MRGRFFFAGLDDDELEVCARTVCRRTPCARLVAAGSCPCVRTARVFIQQQRRLPARHQQVDVRQQLGVDQRAMDVTFGRVDRVTLAQRIQAVALPGVNLACQRQRIEHGRVLPDLRLRVLRG